MSAEDTQGNLTIWDGLRTVDRNFVKPITGKSYRGDSPNPTYIILKLTRAFGPIGDRWGFHVKNEEIRYGKPHLVEVERVESYSQDGSRLIEKKVRREIIREEYHQVLISFWFRDDAGHHRTFDAFGGTPMLYMTKAGSWTHDEDAAKKSLTDAYTKAASWLGACADIYLKLFDDKYQSIPEDGVTPTTAQPDRSAAKPDRSGEDLPSPDKQPGDGQRQTTTPDGW